METGDDSRYSPASLFDLGSTAHGTIFAEAGPAWAAIAEIAGYLEAMPEFPIAASAEIAAGSHITDRVRLGDGVRVEAGAVIQGPAFIGAGTIIGTGAYLRGGVITGERCVLGHCSEFKNCLLFDECQVPHFNYVGDSILGYRAHLGAGAILSNFRLDGAEVLVDAGEGDRIATGLRKFGAVIGDRAEIGCNSVINPGAVIGRDSMIYPGANWSGVLAPNHIVKVRQQQEVVERRGE